MSQFLASAGVGVWLGFLAGACIITSGRQALEITLILFAFLPIFAALGGYAIREYMPFSKFRGQPEEGAKK